MRVPLSAPFVALTMALLPLFGVLDGAQRKALHARLTVGVGARFWLEMVGINVDDIPQPHRPGGPRSPGVLPRPGFLFLM